MKNENVFFDQVQKTIKNRERRFKHLMKKECYADAIAIGEEFLEWINPENQDEIMYLDTEEIQEYLNK
ncbi:hypothetical protein S-PM2d059 [Synechococcus phage S-PM2]|uniref:Hypothetical-Protein / belonging to T4-LIKE GC: 802 n=1 Tax=Synechococcus phage S-PM2 TaxID=238854 RepID=Q5GQX7_BPSYP|nr:Hypothetical-Protein / belonging to T4-LIKE GC: 802 [Synechococcus phage S-PM2]CAF34123.1 Hypothetical-Protein / belonging to T4-LIKE GC: 802 [Synechococcus phage S-PM2]CFW42170.1 hypothetical protein S-PM2d059 [Synechococcus phage S-PM2]